MIKNLTFKNFLLTASLLGLAACSTAQPANDKAKINTALNNAAQKVAAARSANMPSSASELAELYAQRPTDIKVATAYAAALREEGDAEKASSVLQTAIRSSGADAETFQEYATARLELGDYDMAETYARRAIAKDGKNGQAWHVLGIALDAQGKHAEAEQSFRKALDLWDGDPVPIMNNLALNLASQNRVQDAVDILKKAKALAPDRIEVERNFRIISTLNEGPTDFLEKNDKS